MKTNKFFFAAITLFFLGNATYCEAQKTNNWKGGTPGQETNWNCAKNWSANQVPDAFQNVIITDVSSGSGFYPTIKDGGFEVNALILESGAALEIAKKGSLTVVTTLDKYGAGEMEVNGTLYVPSSTYAGGTLFQSEAGIVAMRSE